MGPGAREDSKRSVKARTLAAVVCLLQIGNDDLFIFGMTCSIRTDLPVIREVLNEKNAVFCKPDDVDD
jgi:hypothetical protein